MDPLTVADYRKLLLDRFHQIYQVWMIPGANGHHKIWLFFHAIPEAEREQVSQHAQELLEKQRNLGERFTVLTAPDITLSGEVALSAMSQQSMLESLYVAAQQSITAQPEFVSIAARQQSGHSLSDILTGPLLLHGTLTDESLKPLLDQNEAQAYILAALSQITGSSPLNISFGCTRPVNPSLAPQPPALGALEGPFQLCGSNTLKLQAFQTTAPTANAQETGQHFQSMRYPPSAPATKLLRTPGWKMPVPESGWQRKDLPEFHPLQQSFPLNYALGPDELPAEATPLRRAQVQQLRGYLLHFEQMMRNYLAQLVHLHSLLSVRPQQQTYFAQTVYAVPEVMPLLKGFNSEGLKLSHAAARSLAEDYRRNPVNPYRRQIAELAESPQEFVQRRNQFLDHLLARFGESLGPACGATYETIHNKEKLLQHLPEIGRRRATAGEIKRGSDRHLHESGLEKKIGLLLQRDLPGPGEPALLKFYYLVEKGLLTLPDSSDPAEGAFELIHVLVNWTGNGLNTAFQQQVEALIEEYCGAHLCHDFLWYDCEAREDHAARFADFLSCYEEWRSTPLEPLAAARLRSWLQAQQQPTPNPPTATP